MILHNAIGGEEVVNKVHSDGSHHEESEGELCARGNVSADSGSLVGVKNSTLKSLHILHSVVLSATVNLVQSVHSFFF